MNLFVDAYREPTSLFARIAHNLILGLLLPFAVIGASAQAISSITPLLSPQPRELHLNDTASIHTAIITVPGGDPEDNFAAQNLGEALKQRGVTLSPPVGQVEATIKLLRVSSPEATQLLSAAHLTFDSPMHDEGYVLLTHRNPKGPLAVFILADTAAGVFYGAQTLKQLIINLNGISMLPLGTIRDWPAMKYRGIHDDLSRGPFPTLAYQEHQLEVFAAHKVNLYSPYFEHTLQYSADPLAAPPGSSLTRGEAQELAGFARNLHVLIVPEQEAFGHLHHVLQYEKYSDLAETPHGHVLAPGQPATQPLILSWFTQIAADFPSPFLHIGADEIFELGTGRTKAAVDKQGLGPVYANFLTQIHSTLAPLHRRILFWGDVAGTDPAAVPSLPKDMIAIPWSYGHEDNFDHQILPFKKAGMESWVAPGAANWRVVYPNVTGALDNITGFVEAGQRLGSTGELTTVWDDDGEGLFNLDWFTVLYGAAAGWQPGMSDSVAYTTTFGHVFYGDTTGRIDEAHKDLVAAEDLIDSSDDAFWLDPWSKVGIAEADKLRAKVPLARLHAEHAIELIQIALATDPSLREQDALRAMELGARRLDFIGMKFQLSDEMRSAYARAYTLRNDGNHSTEVRELLYSITSMNGRCQDLRDGYSMLKNLYRDSWLAENRPYWLDNVLVRYDLQIQLWQKRGDDLNTLINQWQEDHTLPTSEAAGIPPLKPSKL